MKRSPLFIRVAMHYYYSPEPWPEPSPAANDIHTTLLLAGLLRLCEKGWESAGEPLKMYVEALGNVPLPVQRWVMPEEEG